MRAPKGLAFAEIQSRQLILQWEPLGYNLTRCHTYTVTLCYHYAVGTGHNQTFRECVKMEHGTNHYTIKNLLPYKNVHVKLILSNPEGRKEGKEMIFQTDEDGEFCISVSIGHLYLSRYLNFHEEHLLSILIKLFGQLVE
ncbi:hypothetical protein E2320_000479 [Naja naja]|nr:hypothetical protein E2320_000479 [Naja naja]